MSDSISFNITRTSGEYIKAHRLFLLRGKVLLTMWLLLTLLAVLFIFGRWLRIMEGEFSGWSHWLDLAPFLAIIFVWSFQIFILSPLLAARSYRNPGVASNVVVNEDGITESGPSGATRSDWKVYTAALERKDAFFLFKGRYGFFFVPKRSISVEVMGLFREMIRRNISNANLRKASHAAHDNPISGTLEDRAAESALVDPTRADRRRMEAGDLNLKIELKKEDIIAGYRAFMRHSKKMRVTWIIIAIIFLYSIYKPALTIINESDIWPISKIVIYYLVAIPFAYYLVPAWIVRRGPNLEGEYDIHVNKDGIHIDGALTTGVIDWKDVTGACEAKEGVLLFERGAAFRLFPRSAFSHEEIERFHELISANVPGAKFATTDT